MAEIQLTPEMEYLRGLMREDVVEHVDHILDRVKARVWVLGGNLGPNALVANAIDDVLNNRDR